MTQRERDRLVALRKADKKLITQKQAAQQTGLSERHLRRLLAKLRSEGDQAVVHAARGRASNRKLSAKAEKTSRGNPLPTRLRRLWPDSGGGVSRAAPRRPSRPRNAAPLDGRRGPVEAPPPQVRTPASVAAPPQLPRRAGAMGHLRARLAGGTRGEAVPDRHDRRRQQRVAGALRPARLGRRESPFAEDVSGTKRPTRSLLHRPRQPVCQHAQKQRRRGSQALASHADRAGAPGAGHRIDHGLFAAGQRPRRAQLWHRPGPPGEGSAGGRGHDDRTGPTPTWKASFCPGGTPRCGCSRLTPTRRIAS